MALIDVGPGLSSEPDLSAGSLQQSCPPLGNGGQLGHSPPGLLLNGNEKDTILSGPQDPAFSP